MASVVSYIPVVNRLVRPSTKYPTVDVPPVKVHNIEHEPDKRPRTLKHLLRANHVNHAIIYHSLQFDNHMPHILCSAYLLGARPDQLHHIYDEEAKQLEPWADSPQEIVEADWRDFLGDKRYQRAYIDFFEDQAAMRHAYDWRKVLDEYLFKGDEPLVHGLIGGLGHPLIHLGYAYEMANREVAMEALGLAATQYNFLHRYLDDDRYSSPDAYPPTTEPLRRATTPLGVLDALSRDARFDGLFPSRGLGNIETLFDAHEALVLEYWNAPGHAPAAGQAADATRHFRLQQEAAAALLVQTVAAGTHAYDFFLVHVLTTSHAVRVLLPLVPPRFQWSLCRAWWLLCLAVYVAELRPRVDPDRLPAEDEVAHAGWGYVEDKAVNGPWRTDAHFVKAVRALKEAAMTWGDVHSRYLAAAVRFVDDFEGWTF